MTCSGLRTGPLPAKDAAPPVKDVVPPAKKAEPPAIKDAPPKKERVAITDPAKAQEDPDFAIQGEYEGGSGADKLGVQVIAQGGGKFALKIFTGGLPGAGWNGMAESTASAKREEKSTAIIGNKNSGSIADGKMTLQEGAKPAATLARIERKSPTLGAKPAEGAIVLYAGPDDVKKWNGGKLIEDSDGKFLGTGFSGNGPTTKQTFGAFQVHVEFRTPYMPNSSSQQRGNSGFYFQPRYECQILDSFGVKTAHNECGGVYQKHKPLVNMCLPPLAWQTYDIDFAPAKLLEGGKIEPARVTILHNGVKIHDNAEFKNGTGEGLKEDIKPGSIGMQNHHDPVEFNNIWVVEKK